MDITALNNVSNASLYKDQNVASVNRNGSFEDFFQSALTNINNTNHLINTAEKEEISYALGLTDDSLALEVAQNKASTALQYTVAVRYKVLEAYKEIMNLQF
jgi:flagellar hook-basal body complex protein FliE